MGWLFSEEVMVEISDQARLNTLRQLIIIARVNQVSRLLIATSSGDSAQ